MTYVCVCVCMHVCLYAVKYSYSNLINHEYDRKVVESTLDLFCVCGIG